ncbi:sulfurtransferase complex subunit TusC [Pseudoalteromonas aurantia]|uniref:Sulfurtransferase complex subunit TusC n=1 Tax=Pseudoalteromonas aurantia TaxID=43654 RepID=A0A5S3V8B1_9GAMM|nr:sulfurtransferase complex subunit TusC [Pseudoalteromonas aurantia]TMO68040.1 sulfurtransferase complex subunit TusC [Pseudoalteromonas aurantia]TMO74038.1 sulfurtransferase complex subunit TusC [Pseudoalteromonas aurantia]
MKNIMVISSHSPFDNMHTRDALDIALIFAAIDQNVSWLFQGPAVLALRSDQVPQEMGIKNFLKSIKMLEIYDIDQVYVCQSALDLYQLTLAELSIDVRIVNTEQQRQLIAQQDQIVTL